MMLPAMNPNHLYPRSAHASPSPVDLASTNRLLANLRTREPGTLAAMSDVVVIKLRGRANYETWRSSLLQQPDLSKGQKAMSTGATSQQPAVGHEIYARWCKDKCHVCNILTRSLDDVMVSGLGAHGKLHATPWELYETIRTYCRPTPAFATRLIDGLMEMRISDFPTPADFVAYVELILVCVEEGGYSMTLTWLLFNTVAKTHTELIAAHGLVGCLSGWTLLLNEVRQLPNTKERRRRPSLRSSDQSGTEEIFKGREGDGEGEDEI
ncbi:hypothetical protein CDEST_11448 [Colletotrichum destructivum]|uniref:Uncharacterized protein n=1 Tax=Colletotrichum destructivum TaxID=34406 RepID=A0AAX4IT93_9PEZI|nr:hypothetical protein CDEST_11448 [Colletotrichum destructivum]